MSAPQEKETNIIVNGRPKKLPGDTISFDQVVALAFPNANSNTIFTVTYRHGNREGRLKKGETINIQNGMHFDVTDTGQS